MRRSYLVRGHTDVDGVVRVQDRSAWLDRDAPGEWISLLFQSPQVQRIYCNSQGTKKMAKALFECDQSTARYKYANRPLLSAVRLASLVRRQLRQLRRPGLRGCEAAPPWSFISQVAVRSKCNRIEHLPCLFSKTSRFWTLSNVELLATLRFLPMF